jgi:hypothetical protein
MPKKTVSNPTTPRVPLDIDGKPTLYLCYSFNAIAQAESLTGLNLLAGLTSRLSASQLRALLYAAALTHQPKLTLEEAGDYISHWNQDKVYLALSKAYGESNPEPEEGEAHPNAPEPGSSS